MSSRGVRKHNGELALLIAPLPQQPFELAFRSSARVTRKCSTAAVLCHRRATTLPRASQPHQTWAGDCRMTLESPLKLGGSSSKWRPGPFGEQGICFPEQGKDMSLDYNNLRLFTSQNMYQEQINDIESRSSIYREEGADSTMKRLNTSIPGRAICLNIAACLCLCYIKMYLNVAYQEWNHIPRTTVRCRSSKAPAAHKGRLDLFQFFGTTITTYK
jgi:hypothetical protein